MLQSIIASALRHRLILVVISLVLVGFGVNAAQHLSVDAFPDVANVQVQIATEAAGSLAVYIAKAITFRALGVLPLDAIIKGLITGSSLTAGSFIAKRFVLRLDPERFRLLMDGLMLVSGIAMLWTAAVPRQVAG